MTTAAEVKEALESAKEEAEKRGRTWFANDEILLLRHLLWSLTEPIPWELAVDLGHSGAVRYWSEINHPKVLPPVEALAAPGKDDTDTIRILRAGAHLFQSSMSSIIDPYQFQYEVDAAAWSNLDGSCFQTFVVNTLRSLLRCEDDNSYTSRSEPDWNLRLPYGPDHELYVKMAPKKSLADPNRISYRDIPDVDPRHRIVTTPGRFLTKFFSHIFDKPRIAALAASFNPGDGELKFARTEKEIIKVYQNGPNSCMSHSLGSYQGEKHPVAVYASPDLGVAYLERGGDITSRALVRYNSDGKPYIHSRIYGDYTRLERCLTAAGIVDDEDGRGFIGARLVKIEHHSGNYIMPYVDHYDVSEGCSDYFVMAEDEEGDYRAKETCGLLKEDNSVWSDIEERYINADEAVSWRGEYVSPEYAEDNLTWSDREGDYIDNEDVAEVNFKCRWSSSGYIADIVSMDWRGRHAFYCEKTDEWWSEDDFSPIEIESMGETWSDWAVEHYGNPDDIEEADAADQEEGDDGLTPGIRSVVNDTLSGKADGLSECVVAYMEKADKDYVSPYGSSSRHKFAIGDIVKSESSPGSCKYGIVADFLAVNEAVLFFPKDGRLGHIGNNRGLFAGHTPGHWVCSLNQFVGVVIPVMYIPAVYEELRKAEADKDEALLSAIAA